jgi:hypothetical protein
MKGGTERKKKGRTDIKKKRKIKERRNARIGILLERRKGRKEEWAQRKKEAK